MDYEKKYKEALNWMKDVYPTLEGAAKEDAEHYFPELAESEDERIRKAVVDAVMILSDSPLKTKMLSWLEKQGEQKVSEYDIVKTIKERIIEHFDNHLIIDKCFSIGGLKDDILKIINEIKFAKQGEQKPAWSEEDESRITAICTYLQDYARLSCSESRTIRINEYCDWLKSLRPQNWTKEDKERYISCLQWLSTGNLEQPETINSKWFKEHVYPQSTWKPSDEQIEALDDFIYAKYPNIEKYGAAVKSLYQDLKKLREE